MAKPLQTSELIFSSQTTNFSEVLTSLKKSTLTIANRLRSILDDSAFVCRVADTYQLPLIANERCGSWYIPPDRKIESAYFKSTDGHMGQWSFSLRRLNTQVLDVIGKHDGCIIVDSTRRGKRMPDALSKTVPIWCAVINRTLFPEAVESHAVQTAPQAVSISENAQIQDRISKFTAQLASIGLDTPALRRKVLKPLRPIWVTRDSNFDQKLASFPNLHLVVLCTASRRVSGAEISEGGYIQGAGDDSEGWSHGLTPSLFWAHREEIMATAEQLLPTKIAELQHISMKTDAPKCTQVRSASWIFVADLDALQDKMAVATADRIIYCSKLPVTIANGKTPTSQLHLKCDTGKNGSRDLRKEICKIGDFLQSMEPSQKLLICCQTGRDLSLGIALAVCCLYCNVDGVFSIKPEQREIDKEYIRRRLAWIITSMPTANPSRATLQAVNAHLMSGLPTINLG